MVKEGEEATSEATVDKTEQVAEAEDDKQPAQDSEQLTNQLESLQETLKKTTDDLDTAKSEARAHQQNVTKKATQIKELETKESKIDAMTGQLDILATMVADIMDRDTGDTVEERPLKRRSEDYLTRLDEVRKKSTQETAQVGQRKHQEIVDEVLRQFKSVGLDAEAMNSPEFIEARVHFLEGNPEGGLEKVRRIVMAKTEAKVEPQESPEEIEKRIEAKVLKKILIDRGELDAEIGQPKGSVKSFADIEEAFSKGDIGYAEYEEHRSKQSF